MTQWHDTEPASIDAELQNARALVDKLQTLNASLQHQVNALHAELARADQAGIDLRQQLAAAPDPEPDLDTVPLQALLEAVGTFLEHGQAVAIHGSYDPTTHVDIHALGRVFRVETREASEMLTHAHELGQCELVKCAR